MLKGFEPRYLAYDPDVATCHRRLYSTILAEFPWYTEALALKPESLLAHCENLPVFEASPLLFSISLPIDLQNKQSFLSSLHAFEDALFHFPGNPHMKDIRGLLGVNVVTTMTPEPKHLIVASHEPTLSAYDFQKLCSVLCAYRLFEIISLRAQCVSRIPSSSPTACMFLPGPPSTKDHLDEFSRLQSWPKLATTFQKLVQNTTDGCSEFRSFSNPVFTLMHMAARNGLATKYLAIEENFLLTAIHIAALKNFPFAEGALPDLPANMPSAPPGGFKDKDSYDRFEVEFDAFIEKCRTEGTLSSTANVASRSPFQLAVMISPLYLLVTRRLSTKSFHRRTVIDLATRLGPHKPSRILAVESAIWDTIFRLAEGRVSVYTVLQDLAKSLPWSDIDMALNCESDQKWFSPKLSMQYNPAISLPLEVSSHPLPIESSVQKLCLPPPLPAVTEHVPSLLFPTVFPSLLAARPNQGPPPQVVTPPLPQNIEVGKFGQAVVFSESFATTQSNCFSPQMSPFRLLQSTPLNPSSTDFEAPTDYTSQPLHPPMSPSILAADSDQANLLQSHSVEDDETGVVLKSFASTQSSCSSPLSSPPRSLPSTPLNLSPPDHEALADYRPKSNSGSDSDNTSDSTQRYSDKPLLGNAKGRGNRRVTHNESDFTKSTSCTPGVSQHLAESMDNDQSDERVPEEWDVILHFTSGDSDKGPTIQSSNTGKPRALTKRRRSSSPIPPRKLGSKEKPIDVDKVASLFEPVLIREYLEEEDISLPIMTCPQIIGSRPYIVFDATGQPVLFTPRFHFEVYHERFRQFFDCVEALYDHGRPIHIARPTESVIKTFTYEAWKALTPAQMQQELRKKNIIVSGWPLREKIFFNEAGLRRVAGPQSRQISINDYSIEPSDNSCTPTVVSGRVRDIWDNCHPSGKILNALDLPLYDGNTEPTEYASDLHAWDVTRGHHHVDQSSSYPTGHMRWALVGHENTMTFLHIDCEGLSTDVTVVDGGKAWGFLRDRPGNPLSSTNFFLKDSFRLDEVLHSSEYDFEVVALRPGDRLFMKPCQPHFVFGYAHSICLGGHFYLTNHMQETLQSLVHSFVLHKFLTNTLHPTRILLRRIIIFYHMGLLENQIPESDPAASHLPDVTNIDGLMNLLSACVLVILGNVLDFRTYRAPTQEEYTKADKNQQILIDHEINNISLNERFAICYARGVALHLFNWIRHCSLITGPGGHIVDDLPSRFFIQIVQTLVKYKEGANASGLDLRANCTLETLTKQVDNIIAVEPCISSLWSKRHLLPSDSLALPNQDSYTVQWVSDNELKWSSLPTDFFRDGITGLDERYFAAQQDRQRLEASLVIPQLDKHSSSSLRSSKRARLG